MQCKNVWNREFMDAACSKTFCNKELKNHRETLLFEREKSLMPATQPYVQRAQQIIETRKLLEKARKEVAIQRELVMLLDQNLRILENEQARGVLPDSEKKAAVVVRRCPCDGCRGFLGSDWKCGVCSKKICSKCNEEEQKEGAHACNPDNVETVKLLKKDTKSCPKCGVLIFRISGCAQMWCPDCHAVFNWNTMKIETGVIHNPHYYEFQRTNAGANAGRNLGDIPCGGFPTHNELCAAIVKNFDKEDFRQASNIHGLITHIQHHELRFGVYRDAAQDVNNLDLRIKYLMNDMDEKEFKVIAQKREKAKNKIRDIANILRMFVDTASDIMRQLVTDKEKSHMNILENLIQYTNTTFLHIHKRYNCATPFINDRAQLIQENYKKQ
jgi:hypothetical protein